jgi:CAP12/Pycsar effector protein, TIR domain
MKTKPRIFVSVPDNRYLDDRRKALKRAIIRFIAEQEFDVVGFEPEQWGAGLPMNLETWTVEKANTLIRRCDGVLILALARIRVRILESENHKNSPDIGRISTLPTPYNHLEGALALAQQLPVLILFEENMDRAGIFDSGIKPTTIPADADEQWINSESFRMHFDAWAGDVRKRRDVFLGYCSKANSSAREIRDYLEKKGFTVLDWSRDFRKAGATIFGEIERAASRCRCAVFLFTEDDELDRNAKGKASFDAVPRDNVLLEAGYFTQARGKERVAIVREIGAKMPADLGGIIYLSLEDRNRLLPVKRGLINFLNKAL